MVSVQRIWIDFTFSRLKPFHFFFKKEKRKILIQTSDQPDNKSTWKHNALSCIFLIALRHDFFSHSLVILFSLFFKSRGAILSSHFCGTYFPVILTEAKNELKNIDDGALKKKHKQCTTKEEIY